ncbi:hypothetical protein ABL78_2221 [Leptomonas seymouri]|uniref:Uncharacterized protein n=1 Tax=Leptomonas seymouri TaxID=5684 RepID=A0A0N1PEF8_LEPSE|nr:hypothetical protein ABL78_2221 [Leptomonas seymouri]|eukprot:KPI88683.1 hypothetical protein ABL78_2221 [Leptomonas seymouri]
MMELCPRRAPGFSTGWILAPRGWTYDAASHYVVHSCRAAATNVGGGNVNSKAACTRAPSDDSDELPVGSSSNTARFECMVGEQEGCTLYVTELFVPRQEVFVSASSEAARSSPWTAERIQRLLQQRICGRGDGQTQNSNRSTLEACDSVIAEVWVREIHATPNHVADHDGADATDEEVAQSISLYNTVRSFFHLFVEVVWVCAGKRSEVPLADTIQNIFADLERQYHTPALQLNTFRCFTHQTSGGTPATSVSPNTAVTTTGASIVAPLREPCAPSVLVDMRSSHVSSLWSTCLYTAPGSAFVQLLLPDDDQAEGSVQPSLSAGMRWNTISRPYTAGPQQGSAAKPGVALAGIAATSAAPAASALRHLLQVQLRLQWEGLSVSMAAPCPRGRKCIAGSRAAAVDVAVATLSIESLHTPTSLHSFVSLEQAWEAHVARSMEGGETALKDRQEEREGGRRFLKYWKLQKLSEAPIPSLGELGLAVDDVEMQQLRMDNPLITAAERAMLYVAVNSGRPPIGPRYSTYLLHLAVANSGEPHTTSEEAAVRGDGGEIRGRGSSTDEWYLLQLHAPRVQSRHAVVVCMAVPAAWLAGECEKPVKSAPAAEDDADRNASRFPGAHVTARWAAALQRSYRLASYTPSLWLPRETGRAVASGVCGRSGRLVLHVPAGDPQYANVNLVPVPAKSFASLGSIAVWACRDESSRCSGKVPLTEGSTFAQVGAVWTLIGDGRSAAAYLEDALMEYMYDTSSKSLNNVSHPSQHTRQQGVLLVRKKQRQKMKAGTASGQSTAASSLVSQEICSVWVDIGTSHRLLLRVRDVGVGEVLVTEASLVGHHTENDVIGAVGDERSASALAAATERAMRAEEEALEKWIEGVAASAVQRNLC